MTTLRGMGLCGVMAAVAVAALAGAPAPGGSNPAPDPNNMKAFPPAAAGQTRFVLQLPQVADESALKVEVIVGRTVQTDGVNRYFFGGKVDAQNIEGWGFTRYVVNQLGPMAGTLMAPPPNAPKVERFVTLGGEPYLIRYNSRLPIVVYVPEGAEVRYRIWSAPEKATPVERG